MTAPAFSATGRRARILRAARNAPVTLSEIVRHIQKSPQLGARDQSLQRLKTTSAVRSLKQARLLARTPDGWVATAAGVRTLAQLETRHG